jgi:hypothetical protein
MLIPRVDARPPAVSAHDAGNATTNAYDRLDRVLRSLIG